MTRRLSIRLAAVLALVLPGAWLSVASQAARATGPNVLLVGTYNSITGTYATIQSAVDAAQPGDWILVGPGVYHETQDATHPSQPAGVWIAKAGLHLRGMNRNTVVVDGTYPLTCLNTCPPNSGPACFADPTVQNPGPGGQGRNGIQVEGVNGSTKFVTDGVSIENLTVCNFQGGSGGNGNEIWWNGGDKSGQIGMNGLYGSYLTASTSFYPGATNPNHVGAAQYAIFTSNEQGPGTIIHTYASNMADSDYYIGACPDCNIDLNDAHAENSALGFSGSNAGGHLIIENSEFDNNRAGIVPNSLNNDDWPTPQNGACPSGTGPTGTFSCTVIRNNLVHDNNNPNTPGSGVAANSAIGSGIELPGDENDVITGNTIYNQGSWGIVAHDFPDNETPPAFVTTPCRGGTQVSQGGQTVCYFVAYGIEVAGNSFHNNGTFGNQTNGDLADDHQLHNPGNCWHDNTNTGTLSSDPPSIQTVMGAPCFVPPSSPNTGDQGPLTAQLACATGFVAQCPTNPAANYPTSTGVTLQAIPFDQTTMPNPCAGVPTNAWCPLSAATPELPLVALPVAAGGLMLGGWTLAARVQRRRRREMA